MSSISNPLDLSAPLVARPDDCVVPLTATQLRWWRHIREQEAGKSERMLHICARLRGPLERDLLRDCVQIVGQRHESLRTRILVSHDSPRQQIDDRFDLSWEFVDLSNHDSTDADARLRMLTVELIREKITLSSGPLVACRLFRLSPQDHVCVIALEHIVSDLLSNAIVSSEIWSAYQHRTRNADLSLPSLALQFPDYAVWQQQTLAGWLARHGTYWRDRLSGVRPSRLPWTSDEARTSPLTYDICRIPFGVDVTTQLRARAREQKTSLPIITLAIYAAAMFRWCDQNDLIIAFVSHSRIRPELVRMVGFLSNFLHLRVTLASHDTFLDLLRRVTHELQSAYDHRDFDRVPDLVPECCTDLYFDWIPSEPTTSRNAGTVDNRLRVEPLTLDLPLPRPFCLLFADTRAGIMATVTYQPQHISSGKVRNLATHLTSLATEFARNPATEIRARHAT
jgi:hypothetical protein